MPWHVAPSFMARCVTVLWKMRVKSRSRRCPALVVMARPPHIRRMDGVVAVAVGDINGLRHLWSERMRVHEHPVKPDPRSHSAVCIPQPNVHLHQTARSKSMIKLLSFVFVYTFACITHAALSIPPTDGNATNERAVSIAETAAQIKNGERTFPIAGVEYPFYYGPQPLPDSLTTQIQLQEVEKLMTFRTTYPTYMASLASNNTAHLTSMKTLADLYNQAASVVERPMSMDNSDETFGHQRVTIQSFALRQATRDDFAGRPLSLNDYQISRLCGLGATSWTLPLFNALFVENFSDIAQWNDPARPDKYVPNVVGFFCVHLFTKKLLPIEIRLLDTNLAYTPFDTADDWALAKMALEAASVDFHQMQHMAETHAVTIPLRVEMLRTMHADHPVRALLLRHVFADFGLEKQVAVLLLNTSTGLDKTFGWGASGSTRFLYHQTQGVGISVKEKAFHADLRLRGLDHIPTHKYVAYGSRYWTAIENFVGQFVDVYYTADCDVRGDEELQHWATESSKIPHLRDFESSISTKLELRDLLTTLIFQSTVKHHAMNGAATWHGMTAPYSPAALWKPLPTRKLRRGESLDLLAYTVPRAVVPAALALSALFIRPVPTSESMLGSYKSEPFTSEPLLQTPISMFEDALRSLEQMITQREASEKWPYVMLRPSCLPHYTWV